MLVFDNIIFSLQHFGGISSIWKQIIEATLPNADALGGVRFIEYDGAQNNAVRMHLHLPDNAVEMRRGNMLGVKRLANPRMAAIDTPFVFHSSYYRYCTNPNALNITTVHDFVYEHHIGGLAAKIHAMQKHAAVKHSAAIVCISENTRNDLLKFYPETDPARVHVIYNSIDPIFLSCDTHANTHLDTSKAPSHNILFVGVRHQYKNFGTLVHALAPLTDYSLHICGAPLTGAEDEFLEETLGAERYRWLGALNASQLRRAYQSTCCLIYPSKYEGFGLPVLEAQASGCPVLANNTSSLPEIIGDHRLLLNDITTDSIRHGLGYIAANRSHIVAEGIANAGKYTPQATTSAYINLYKQLLNKQ